VADQDDGSVELEVEVDVLGESSVDEVAVDEVEVEVEAAEDVPAAVAAIRAPNPRNIATDSAPAATRERAAAWRRFWRGPGLGLGFGAIGMRSMGASSCPYDDQDVSNSRCISMVPLSAIDRTRNPVGGWIE
jgi:hypothetical protein